MGRNRQDYKNVDARFPWEEYGYFLVQWKVSYEAVSGIMGLELLGCFLAVQS